MNDLLSTVTVGTYGRDEYVNMFYRYSMKRNKMAKMSSYEYTLHQVKNARFHGFFINTPMSMIPIYIQSGLVNNGV